MLGDAAWTRGPFRCTRRQCDSLLFTDESKALRKKGRGECEGLMKEGERFWEKNSILGEACIKVEVSSYGEGFCTSRSQSFFLAAMSMI